ncbi:MAG: 16S rRNA (guanine(966)-N(2))-methyltransferase RsmD [Planctomycetota bacterium]
MRIVAGRFRGRRLDAPPGHATRPITDRVKENLFNILGHRLGEPGSLPPVAVLDLFSGPGSLGIEALSRGATTCTFVERDRTALRALRQNLEILGLADRTRIIAANAWTMHPPEPQPAAGGAGYGLIFVDPPYRDATDVLQVTDLLERLAPVLDDDGLIVFRHEVNATIPPADPLGVLEYADERVYGRMRLMLIRKGTKGRRDEGTR